MVFSRLCYKAQFIAQLTSRLVGAIQLSYESRLFNDSVMVTDREHDDIQNCILIGSSTENNLLVVSKVSSLNTKNGSQISAFEICRNSQISARKLTLFFLRGK